MHIVEKLRKPQFKMTTAGFLNLCLWDFHDYHAGVVYTAVYAADIFSMAKSAMQKVYNDVVGIATVAAVVCSAVCLFLMNFSKSGKTVDESRTWLKRIVICWAVLMVLGAIVNYMEVLVPQQNFTG
mgnify:CR=1 FL=1